MINIESLVKRAERIIDDECDALQDIYMHYDACTRKWDISTLQADPHKSIFVKANTLPGALNLFKEELRRYK